MKKHIILVFLLVSVFQMLSQNTLRLSYERLGRVKSFEFFNGDLFDYKLRGKLFYKQNKIVNLQDSIIVFSNDSVVKLNQIKKIRVMSSSHLAKTMQDVFVSAGVGFILLNTINNAIYSRTPLVDPAAVYISGGLIGAAMIIKALRTKNIRITKNKSLKIIETDYQNLNKKQFN